MATTTYGGIVNMTTDPALNDGAAASAAGVPLAPVQVRINTITASPIPSATGSATSGRIDLRDGGTILGTWGIEAASASAGIPAGTTIIPVGMTYAFATGINLLWTKGINCTSAAVNYTWGP